MTGGVERMDDDCECTEGEGVMIGDGSGGAEGEEACEGDVGEGEVGGIEREVGKGEKSENEKGEWGDTYMVVVASVSSSSAVLGESVSVGRRAVDGGPVPGGGFCSHLLPEMRERRIESSECFVHVLLCPTV